jgi:hypothetical protein
MNREQYLSKRSRPQLQKPADREIAPKDKAEVDIEPAPPLEPAESRTGNTAGAAKQEKSAGR